VWLARQICPFGLSLITPKGEVLFNSTAESYSSWHEGDPFIEGTDTGDPSPFPPGVYDGEARYGPETCSILLELDQPPPATALPTHIRLQMLACRSTDSSAGSARAVAVPAAPPPPAAAPPSPRRRLLQASSEPASLLPVVIDMSEPDTVFLASNSSVPRIVLAAFASRSTPAAYDYDPTADRYWLVVAPMTAALGGPLAPLFAIPDVLMSCVSPAAE
jgi:hypothetical protein